MDKIYSPLNGSIKALELGDDAAFSEKMMGDGIAITPSEGVLFAPADAKVTIRVWRVEKSYCSGYVYQIL